MEQLERLKVYQKLILAPHVVRTIRASVLASYWWCSEKARLQALGVQEKISSEAMELGTLIHNNIIDARKLSPIEKEFAEAMKPFYTIGEDGEPVIERTYKCNKVKVDGTLLTHGADEWKVTPDRKAWIIEYKTKGSIYVNPVSISPARFQNKLYCWLHAPIFKCIPFELAGGQIVFLKRVGRSGNFKEIGQTEYMQWNKETERTFLLDVERIIWYWNNPTKQIPPKRWKCLRCSPIYKDRCVFQQHGK